MMTIYENQTAEIHFNITRRRSHIMKNKLIVSLACLSLLAPVFGYCAGAVRVPDGDVTLENGYLNLYPSGKGTAE
jgi:hypothetical protein